MKGHLLLVWLISHCLVADVGEVESPRPRLDKRPLLAPHSQRTTTTAHTLLPLTDPLTDPYRLTAPAYRSEMADRGRGGGFGSRGDRGDRGGRGGGRGGRRGARRGAAKNEEKEWQPVTKLGRLVKAGKIKSMEEIYLHSLPIKEYQIVDWFLPKLKDEVMKVRLGRCCHRKLSFARVC